MTPDEIPAWFAILFGSLALFAWLRIEFRHSRPTHVLYIEITPADSEPSPLDAAEATDRPRH